MECGVNTALVNKAGEFHGESGARGLGARAHRGG